MQNEPTAEASNPPSQATSCGSYPATVCSASEFEREYFGMLPEPNRELMKLASEYHERTEAYDRAICTGPILHGGIMPETPHQRRAIQRHASAVWIELFSRVRELGYNAIEWRRALDMELRRIERQNPGHEARRK